MQSYSINNKTGLNFLTGVYSIKLRLLVISIS